MTVEYVLLLSMFVYFVFGTMTATPIKTFADYGPRLGARVENNLTTGEGFTQIKGLPWKKKE